MTAKKSSSRKAAPRRPGRTDTATRAKAAPVSRARPRKTAATKSGSRRKPVKAVSTMSAIGAWMHEAGQKLKTAEKKVARKVKTKLRRLLHMRPRTA